ncbi:hypothetical protein [Sphingobacterium sp. SYP-B4668]|uniref:hypothetical protein n=1 Tax=Sphingobacterium sp. SYP-B4668 TaxID=2996035 RepID=UPI0022DDDC24|nr:hypothetical protein [Sphingobacterium sp. SYP-B4668]
MAFQKGNIKLEGNIGDLNFYKSGDEYRVRQKVAKKSKNEISNLAERSKENAQEFGRVSSFAKNIRSALKNAMGQHYELFYEPSNLNRLVKRLNLILKADKINMRGKREILPANMMLLKNFSFNNSSPLKDTLLLPIDIDYNKNQREVVATISNFNPEFHLDIPKETSSFMVHLTIFKIDHLNMDFTTRYTHSELLFVRQSQPFTNLICQIDDLTATESMLVALGVSLYKDTAGYPVPQIKPNLNSLDITEFFCEP